MKRMLSWTVFGIILQSLWMPLLHAQEKATSTDAESRKNPAQVRKFGDVLNELLKEFVHDLKTNQIKGLKNVSMRRVAVSESIPSSYENYIESMIAERIRSFSKIKVIQCTNCRLKRSVVEGGRVTITVPINNPAELDSLASTLGVDVWIDAALLYQETNMILAFNAFDSKTKELLWTKVYNSENLTQQNSNKAVDDPGVLKDEDGRYIPQYVASFGIGYHLIPNVNNSYSHMMGLSLRVSEQFNSKRSEIGGVIFPVFDPKSFVTDYQGAEGISNDSGSDPAAPTTKKIAPFKMGLGFMATYHHNSFTGKENFDEIRSGMQLGVGTLFAPGYLTFTGKVGGNIRLGRRFIIELSGTYNAPTSVTFKVKKYETKGGPGGEVTFGILF